MRFVLPPLPYPLDALAPTLSKRAVEVHYKGHLKGYVDKLNRLPAVSMMPKRKLEEVIIEGKHEHVDERTTVLPPGSHPSTMFNLSAQVYNHTFFFRSMSPGGGGEPNGDIKDIVEAQYGSYDAFKKKVIARGKNLFGSGWVWICLDDENQLIILRGLDAETPITYRGLIPILCIDVWEHAYYLDYENKRGDYLTAVMNNLLNWEFANKNIANAG